MCIDVCPLTGSETPVLFVNEATGKIRVRKNVCVGCGLCESRCPTEPAAIRVLPFAPAEEPLIA